MKNYIEYDEEADTLILRKADEKIVESINDRYICLLQLNTKKDIVGLEFLNFRNTFNIPTNILKKLKDCEVNIRYEHEEKLLHIQVKLFYEHEKETIAIPISLDMGNRDFTLSDFNAPLASA